LHDPTFKKPMSYIHRNPLRAELVDDLKALE